MTPLQWFTAYLALTGSARAGSNWQCPAHRDSTPSLSVAEGADGRVLVCCHAGCRTERVLHALGLNMDVLFTPRPWTPEQTLRMQLTRPTYPRVSQRGSPRRPSARRGTPQEVVHHTYIPGLVRLERRRFFDGKVLSWESRRREADDWLPGLGQWRLRDLPLYQEDQIRMGMAAGEDIFLCESESSVDALMRAGFYATTWAGGAASPQVERLRHVLAEAHVVWVPDNDPSGLRCSETVAALLSPISRFSTVTPRAGEDARDLLKRVGASALGRMAGHAASAAA